MRNRARNGVAECPKCGNEVDEDELCRHCKKCPDCCRCEKRHAA